MQLFIALSMLLTTTSAVFFGGKSGGAGIRFRPAPIRARARFAPRQFPLQTLPVAGFGLAGTVLGPRPLLPVSVPVRIPVRVPVPVAVPVQVPALAPRFAPGVIQRANTIEFRPIPDDGNVEEVEPLVVAIDGADTPVEMLFRSVSSNVNVQQAHVPSPGSHQDTQSEDEPHILRHQVIKPIIQQIHEVVTPVRKITQEIMPVQEDIQTIVAKNGANGFGGARAAGGCGASPGRRGCNKQFGPIVQRSAY